ncbi:MAG: DUF4301 family protein, partial [Muribaculaceae bacterium]|nr:DUF4301 family protein [Muribaculaceae bacterium]
MQITVKDIETLKRKGTTEEQLKEELKMLKEGFPYLKIEAAATPGHGIFVLDEKMENQSMEIWNQFLASGAKVMKMVPASGAASRMFKDLFSFINGKDEKPSNDFMKKFFN